MPRTQVVIFVMVISSQCGGVSGSVYCNEMSFFVHTRQSLAAQCHYATGCQEMLTEICYSPFNVRKHIKITDICDVKKWEGM